MGSTDPGASAYLPGAFRKGFSGRLNSHSGSASPFQSTRVQTFGVPYKYTDTSHTHSTILFELAVSLFLEVPGTYSYDSLRVLGDTRRYATLTRHFRIPCERLSTKVRPNGTSLDARKTYILAPGYQVWG